MNPQSLELHSIENRFGGRRFDNNAGQGCRRLYPEAFANERIRIVQITLIPSSKICLNPEFSA
jgi:hypothetical protein